MTQPISIDRQARSAVRAPIALTGVDTPSGFRIWVLAAALLALAVRLAYILKADFPMNDGGLFYQMVLDIERAGYALPAYTTYNGGGIPLVYPPLAFYPAALLHGLAGWDLVAIFRFLPLAINVLTVAVFASLAQALLPGRSMAALAVLVFAILPQVFVWPVMGGGLTRAFGMLFAVLAIYLMQRVYTRDAEAAAGRRWTGRQVGLLALATLCSAAAVMSHLEFAWFAAYSIAILAIFLCRSRAAVAKSAIVVAGVLLLSTPWWGSVLARHGVAPFLSAVQGSSHEYPWYLGPLALGTLQFTFEAGVPLLALLALAGLYAAVRRKELLIPFLFVGSAVLQGRGVQAKVSIYAALLAGWTLAALFGLQVGRRWLRTAARPGTPATKWGGRLAVAVLLACAAAASALSSPSLLSVLPAGEREAMAWVAENTPQGSRFLVISGDSWAMDRSSEWFPVLAQRPSVATVQGYELYGGNAFVHRTEDYVAAQACAGQDGACLESWLRETGRQFAYVYVARRPAIASIGAGKAEECCAVLAQSLRATPAYRLVHQTPGADVFERVGR